MKIGFVNFTPLTYDVETPYKEPLGGSESSLCYLAEALANRGHTVNLFGRFPKSFTARKVIHIPDSALKDGNRLELDFLIIQNTPYFGMELKPKLEKKTKLIFWTGHGAYQPTVEGLMQNRISNVFDAFIFASFWQMETYVEKFKLERKKCMILRNAISPVFEPLYQEEENILLKKSNPPVLAYTSTPYCGLELLIDLFPRIRKEVPTVRLKIFSSLTVYQHSKESDEKDYGHLYALCRKTEGVEYIGSIPQPKLARELKSALILAYPNVIPETSSISVMEAMAAGCQVVTSSFGALPETTAGFGKLIPIGESKEEYSRLFVDQTVQILNQFLSDKSEQLVENLSHQLIFTKNCYTWRKRALEWEKLFALMLKNV